MESLKNNMRKEGKNVYISRYEVATAFFRTEEEGNVDMANALNVIINIFCDEEQRLKRNITELPFDIFTYRKVIDYIEKTALY